MTEGTVSIAEAAHILVVPLEDHFHQRTEIRIVDEPGARSSGN